MKKYLLLIAITIIPFQLAVIAQGLNFDEDILPKRSLSFNLLDPLNGDYTLGYEHFIKAKLSLEFKAKMLGNNLSNPPFNELGYSFSLGPKINISRIKDDKSPIQSFFVKPSIRYLNLTEHYSFAFGSDNNINHQSLEFIAEIGKRFVFSNRFYLEPTISFVSSYHLKNNFYNHTSNRINFYPIINLNFGILLFK